MNIYAINLKTNNLDNPIGISDRRPEFSWNLQAGTGEQSAWQIQAANSIEALEREICIWDSGKTAGSRSFAHRYGGPALQSRDQIWWRVRLWDENAKPGSWSKPASFEIGLNREEDWTAQWVGFRVAGQDTVFTSLRIFRFQKT